MTFLPKASFMNSKYAVAKIIRGSVAFCKLVLNLYAAFFGHLYIKYEYVRLLCLLFFAGLVVHTISASGIFSLDVFLTQLL